jgi:hypothetical protein
VVARLDAKLRDDPARQVLIKEKVLSQRLGRSHADAGRGLLYLVERHLVALADVQIVRTRAVNNVQRNAEVARTLFTAISRGKARPVSAET